MITLKEPSTLLATWFGSGLLKPAPGTWGTLAALPFTAAITYLFGTLGLLIFIPLTFGLGLWSGKRFGDQSGHYDDGRIVIDEVCGVAIALLPAALNPLLYLIAFILFRGLDILKPFPVSYFDQKMPNEWGMMMDDVAAGIMSALILGGMKIWFF